MFTIKTLNAISPVGLAKLNKNLFDVSVGADAPDGILVRSADLLNTTFKDNLLAIARAGAGVNNIPLDRCSEQGIVVFNTPGANANAVAELSEQPADPTEDLAKKYAAAGAEAAVDDDLARLKKEMGLE